MTTWERVVRAVDNPIIVKDGVSRMRTWRAPMLLTVYVGVLGALGFATFAYDLLNGSGANVGSAVIGADVFTRLAFIQLSLICLFAPALAAGAISGERERQTLDVLLVSRVSALGIVWGKLVTSVAFMLLLILAALPLFAAVFLFGGIDFGQFLVTQLLTVTTAVSVGAVSLLFSAASRRTLTSTVGAYAATFTGLVGTLAVGVVLTQAIQLREGTLGTLSAAVHPLEFFNPIYALNVVLFIPNGAPLHVGRLVALFFLVPGRGVGAGPSIEPWLGVVLVQLALIGLSVFDSVRLVRSRRVAQPRPPAAPDEPEIAAELDMDDGAGGAI